LVGDGKKPPQLKFEVQFWANSISVESTVKFPDAIRGKWRKLARQQMPGTGGSFGREDAQNDDLSGGDVQHLIERKARRR
jgi:hypothetical protein